MKVCIQVVLCCLGAVLIAAAPARAANPAGVAAEVNNDKIMLADVERKLEVIKAQEPSLTLDTPEAKTAVVNLRQGILEEMISNQLVYQEAKRLGLTPPKDAVEALFLQFKSQFKDEAEMQKDLKRQGKSVADLRAMIATKLLVDELTEQWIGDVIVNDEDVDKYYQANQEQFKAPEGVRTRHILIGIKLGATAEEKKKAKSRADNLFAQVQAKNADFAKIARASSDDPMSRDQGGALGVLVRDDDGVLEPLKKAIFAAPVGKPILVESAIGYHILKVEEKIPARVVSLAEVKTNPSFPLLKLVKGILLQQKRDERYEQKLEELRAKSKIKKYL